MDKVTIVFVLGAPGSGKGTQCAKIVEKYGWTHLSTGDLLRAEVQAGTELGQQVDEIMAAGQMVPNDLILELLTNAMASSGSSRFLIDGFPRTLDQLMEFQTQIKPCDGVLVFSVPEEVAVERLLARDVTSGRADDNEDTIQERLALFWADSQPVIEFLADAGGNVHEVDSAAPEEEVFGAVEPFMEEMDALAAEKEEGRADGDAGSGGGDGATADDDSSTGGGAAAGLGALAGAGSELSDATLVFVLGTPGSDLEGQCALAGERYEGWSVVLPDELLRVEVERGTELGQQAAELLSVGQDVPSELLVDVVAAALTATPPARRRFLLCGFPRHLGQLEAFETRVRPADGVLILTLPEELAVERLAATEVYDSEEAVRDRLDGFRVETQPVIDILRDQGLQVADVDAAGEAEEVFAQVATFIEGFGAPLPQQEEQPEEQPQETEQQQAEQEQAQPEPQAEEGQEQEAEAKERQEEEQQQQPEEQSQPEAGAAEDDTVALAAEPDAAAAEPEPESQDAPPQGEGAAGGEWEYSEDQVKAAIRIQAARRGYEDRRRVAALREAKRAELAATAAAAAAEAEAAAAEAAEAEIAAAEAEAAAEEDSEKQVKAAIKIQAARRGYKDRQRVAGMRAEQRRQMLLQQGPASADQADQQLQQRQEGEEAEAEPQQEETAVAAVAAEAAGDYSEEQVRAAIRIQAARRGYEARKQMDAMRQVKRAEEAAAAAARAAAAAEEAAAAAEEAAEAAAEAQAEVEEAKAEMEEAVAEAAEAEAEAAEAEGAPPGLSYDEAIVRIQAAGRGYLDRKKVAAMRAEAAAAKAAEAAAEATEAAAEATSEEAAAAEAAEAEAAEAAAAEAAAVEAAAAEAAAAAAAELEAKALEQVSSIRGMLVVCGPSGVGKGTLIGRLMADHSEKFGFSVSHTTRGPRPGEENGVHYHFSDRTSMQRDIESGLFLEYADVHGNMYGTSLGAVAAVGQSGRIAVLDIDVQGASKIKSSRAASKARYVFVDPPSLETLEARLRGRGTESEDKVRLRLANAGAELERSRQPGFFDARLVNDELEAAYHRFKTTIEQLMPGTFAAEDLALPVALAAPPPLRPPSAVRSAANGPASPGAAAAASSLPVRQYMDATVVPVLREALRSLNEARPGDPLKYVADFLMAARANGGRHPNTTAGGAGSNGKTMY